MRLPFYLMLGLAFTVVGQTFAVDADYAAGVQSLGMGGVGVASGERASAVSLNVGRLASLEEYAAEAFTAKLFGLIRANYLAGVVPFSDRRALGVDWLNVAAEDSELAFVQNRIRAAYAYRPWEGLGVGFGLNYRTQQASLDDAVLGTAGGWSADLGAIWSVPRIPGAKIGVSVRNWMSSASGGRWRSGAWLRVDDGPSQRIAERTVAGGISYEHDRLLAATEWHDGFRFGGEWRASKRFALRSGLFVPNRAGEGTSYSFGATTRWRWGGLDYALLVPPTLSPTSYVALTFGTSYLIPPVEIEGVALKNFYVSLREYYARAESRPRFRHYDPPDRLDANPDERIGEIRLHNAGREVVRVNVRLWIDDYTSRRGTEVVEGVEIAPGERKIVAMQKLVLSDEALKLTENMPVEVRVEVADVRNESRRRAGTTTTSTLFARNRILLDDIGKLAVYISPTDRTVREFALQALQTYPEPEGGLSEKINKALVLFSALQGIGYERDPNLPRESGTIDAIKFPRELLAALEKTTQNGQPLGDCDDSTILVCSLFESVGIQTALIQTPSHVFMAFNAGDIPISIAQQLGWDGYFVGIDGLAWIPLETTLLKSGFAEAWKEGIRQTENGILDSVTTQVAWDRYGNFMPKMSFIPLKSDEKSLRERVSAIRDDAWFRLATEVFTIGGN